ncbi:MAG: flagellar hook-length control protein FliK [Porticoccaceae bacterium]
MLQALVTDKAPSGQLVLRIAGHQITATADIPVQKGAVLSLEVSRLTPQPTLKILGSPLPASVAANASAEPHSGNYQGLVVRQNEVVLPLQLARHILNGVNIPALLPALGREIDAIFRSLTQFSALRDPKVLKALLSQSYQSDGENTSPIDAGSKSDMKSLLSRLLTSLDANLLQQAGDHELAQLQALRDASEGALSRLALSQIKSAVSQEGAVKGWYFELPILMEQELRNLFVVVEQEKRNSGRLSPSWRLWLALDAGKLGPVEAEIFYGGEALSVVLYAEREATYRAMKADVGQLRDALEARGDKTGVINCRQGLTGRTFQQAISMACLEAHV